MPLPLMSGEFRVASDPELKFTPSGAAMLRLTLVANSRKRDQNDQWVDDKTLWVFATAWKQQAEAAAESLTKGDLVVVTGEPYTNEYEDNNGVKQRSLNMNIREIGPSLKWDAHRKIESTRSTSTSAPASTPAADPWGGSAEEPPF